MRDQLTDYIIVIDFLEALDSIVDFTDENADTGINTSGLEGYWEVSGK